MLAPLICCNRPYTRMSHLKFEVWKIWFLSCDQGADKSTGGRPWSGATPHVSSQSSSNWPYPGTWSFNLCSSRPDACMQCHVANMVTSHQSFIFCYPDYCFLVNLLEFKVLNCFVGGGLRLLSAGSGAGWCDRRCGKTPIWVCWKWPHAGKLSSLPKWWIMLHLLIHLLLSDPI
jgi:hypothetical protein